MLSPDLPCSDGGLAMCGKEVSDTVYAMGDRIYETFFLPSTPISINDTMYDLGGTYNEPVFRLLATTGELVHALFFFLAAHVDVGGLIDIYPAAASCESDTAGQLLDALERLDGPLLSILSAPLEYPDGLAQSRDSMDQAVRWLTGGRSSDADILRSLPNQREEALGMLLIDNGDFRIGACDSVQFNLAMLEGVFSDYYDAQPASGCSDPVPPRSIQLPKTNSEGFVIDYDALFAAATLALDRFGRAVINPSISIGFSEIANILTHAGFDPIPALMEIYPGILFRDGFSVFTPLSSGSGIAVEAEVNQDAPDCSDGKSDQGTWVCKGGGGRKVCVNQMDTTTGKNERVCRITEDTDYSASIFHGDADHFSKRIAADNIFISEELLDLYGASPTDFFRKAHGGGYLLYLEPKYPDLRGLLKIDEGVMSAITDETKPPCDRFLAPWLTGKFASPDARTLNALLNFAVIEAKFCGNEAIDTIGDTLFSCGGTSLEGLSCASSLDFNCGGDFACDSDDFSCDGGDFDLDCSPDLSDFDFGCDSFDFDLGCPAPTQTSAQAANLPMCMISDSVGGNLPPPSARAVRRLIRTAFRPKPTPGSIAGMAVNFGLFLSPIFLIPLLRRAGRR